MKTLPREEANEEWDKLWDSMRSEWFKVEVLQDYSAEDQSESLNAWMTGDKERSLELLRTEPNPWSDDCRAKVERGVVLTRIHVVDYPLSTYLQWEVEAYKIRNVPNGKENVYLVDRNNLERVDLPDGDLMMFDQKNVVIGHYDETGYARSQTFYDQSDDLTPFIELRQKLLDAPLEKIS
ncbi:MAG: hypothetical protein JWM52_615 [Candidatus Saccharibacteria bacterium]|nr:hypothetical protein [Candidatus Saccharibacteria bacterium]